MKLRVLAAAVAAACFAVPALAQPKIIKAVMRSDLKILDPSRGLSGIVTSPIPVFWNIEKK